MIRKLLSWLVPAPDWRSNGFRPRTIKCDGPAPSPPKGGSSGVRAPGILLQDVKRLRLEPGDILLVRHERVLSREQRKYLGDVLREEIPGHKIMVLEAGLTFEVVRAQEAAT